MMKSWAENLSCVIGGDGEIDDNVLELGQFLLDSGVTIRLAEPDDIPDVCRLVSLMSPDGFSHDYTDATRKYVQEIQPKKDYFLWVAEKNGKILGTAMLHLQHKLSYHCGIAAHLEDVVVSDLRRGEGCGEALVKTAIACAVLHRCYKIMLTCRDTTIPYYTRFGFEQHDVGLRLSLKEQYGEDNA